MQGMPYEDLTKVDKFRKAYPSLVRKLKGTTEVAPPVRSRGNAARTSAIENPRDWLHGLRKFIDRPETTHKQIVTALTKERIRGFVCLASDIHKHVPADFTESLAYRLAAIEAENLHAEIWQAFNEQRGNTYPLRIDSLTEIDTYARLCQSLNNTLYQKNGKLGGKKLEDFEKLNDAQQRDRIVDVIKSGTPQVAFIEVDLPHRQGLRTWFGRRETKRVRQLCEWVDLWNEGWRHGSRKWHIAAIAVVLVLGVDAKTFELFARQPQGERTPSTLLFQQVQRQDFINWIADASTMMQAISRPAYSKTFVETKSEFDQRLTQQGSDFPLYYQEFSETCKLLISNKR